jgi:death-on-curing protein
MSEHATRYLTSDELIYINAQLPIAPSLHDSRIVTGRNRVRDLELLETCALSPTASAGGADAYPTLPLKAAVLLHAIARYHPFADGNKRTATVAALFMLAVNGQRVTWDADEALEKIVAVAEGTLSKEDFAAWLSTAPGDPPSAPDAGADARRIAHIITEHAGLLAALAER